MLSDRYKYDGREILPLNKLQVDLRDVVTEKVDSGIYAFEITNCCVCGCSKTESLAEKDRYGLKLPVVICRECGLIFTNPRMDQKSYEQFYNLEYRELYHGIPMPYEELFNKGLSKGKGIARFILDSGAELSGKRIYEVGCGAGGILAHFRDVYGCNVAGCDFGSQGVQYGIENHGLLLHEGSLGSSELPWKPDIIIYSDVFEHILDLNNECQTIKDHLNERGLIYVGVPSVKSIYKRYKKDFLMLLQNAHTYHFTLRTLQNVMARNGFKLKSGNEYLNALFIRDPSNSKIENDYNDVMLFLKHTEKLRVHDQGTG